MPRPKKVEPKKIKPKKEEKKLYGNNGHYFGELITGRLDSNNNPLPDRKVGFCTRCGKEMATTDYNWDLAERHDECK